MVIIAEIGYNKPYPEVAEWSIAPDCKSGGVTLRRFDPFPPDPLEFVYFFRKTIIFTTLKLEENLDYFLIS